MKRVAFAALLVALPLACARERPRLEPPGAANARTTAASAAVALAASSTTAVSPPAAPRVAWLPDESPREALSARLAPPPGFTREAVAAGGFGEFLRALPLEPPGARVIAYDGSTVLAGDDRRVAAVVALDVGRADLQQCADSIVRLHAEWRWSQGARDHAYAAAASLPLPLARFVAGERVVARGAALEWRPLARRRTLDHALFREYLDTVFAWANTGSLARDARVVDKERLRAGDFFVLPGAPGHAVLVLDVATHPDGRRVALIGQGFMPAQSFHVLRPAGDVAWFTLDPAASGVKTPFWAEFPWSSLRRLDPG